MLSRIAIRLSHVGRLSPQWSSADPAIQASFEQLARRADKAGIDLQVIRGGYVSVAVAAVAAAALLRHISLPALMCEFGLFYYKVVCRSTFD